MHILSTYMFEMSFFEMIRNMDEMAIIAIIVSASKQPRTNHMVEESMLENIHLPSAYNLIAYPIFSSRIVFIACFGTHCIRITFCFGTFVSTNTMWHWFFCQTFLVDLKMHYYTCKSLSSMSDQTYM